MTWRRILVAVAVAALLASATAEAAEVRVRVIGLSDDVGLVHAALYNDPAKFPTREGTWEDHAVPPNGRQGVVVFDNVPPGDYAAAAFHDTDANYQFNQGLFGIPLEDFGFSNGARVLLSPPTFEAARFVVPPEGVEIEIRLND